MICVNNIILNEAEIKTAQNFMKTNSYGNLISKGARVTFKDGTIFESDQFTTADIMAEINKREDEIRKRQL